MQKRIERRKILVVDDIDTNRCILREILQKQYDVEEAAGGYEALSMLLHGDIPDLVLLDVMMPEINGFEVFKVMRNNVSTADMPVIFITASGSVEHEITALKLGAADYITKPFQAEAVRLRVDNCMELNAYRRILESKVDEKVKELIESRDTLLEMLAEMIEYRDIDSKRQVKRTGKLVSMLVDKMLETEYREELVEQNHKVIVKAAPLHDVGKIAIPDSILLKAGKLTDEEYTKVKEHTLVGGAIMDRIQSSCDEIYYRHGRDICMYHHERWDGTGYPHGLKGKEIPLPARLMSVIDVYDALVSERPYKQPCSHDEALKIILEGAGTQFDPDIAALFCNMKPGVSA